MARCCRSARRSARSSGASGWTGTAVTSAGLLAAVLCGLGLYGILAFAVHARRREIAVRVALGARAADVVRAMSARAGRLLLIGLAAGSILAVPASRLIGGLVFGVQLGHPAVYVSGATLLGLVSLLACWVPVRRALRVQPRESWGRFEASAVRCARKTTGKVSKPRGRTAFRP